MTDRKFGKLPHKHDPRTLMLADYLVPANLPVVPQQLDYSPKVDSWPMYGNDRIGDCTCAAAGHMVELWTAMNPPYPSKSVKVSQTAVTKMYSAVSGYDPKTGANDNGAVELDVLNYWRKSGLTPKAHKLYAFAQVDQHNHDMVRTALYLFGGLYIGFGISDPDQLFREFDAHQPWTPEAGQITEGHAVDMVGYDPATLGCVSWGRLQRMTWSFWDAMVDEAWALLPIEWKARTGIAELNFDQLATDLVQVGHQQ